MSASISSALASTFAARNPQGQIQSALNRSGTIGDLVAGGGASAGQSYGNQGVGYGPPASDAPSDFGPWRGRGIAEPPGYGPPPVTGRPMGTYDEQRAAWQSLPSGGGASGIAHPQVLELNQKYGFDRSKWPAPYTDSTWTGRPSGTYGNQPPPNQPPGYSQPQMPTGPMPDGSWWKPPGTGDGSQAGLAMPNSSIGDLAFGGAGLINTSGYAAMQAPGAKRMTGRT